MSVAGAGAAGVVLNVPASGKPTASLDALSVRVRRCPTPELQLDATYTVDVKVPFGVDGALKQMNIAIPMGQQRFNTTQRLEQGGELQIALVPQTGIASISALGSTIKFGVAIVVKNITVVAASVAFDLAFRVCAFAATCTDVPLIAGLAFGSPTADVCCLDKQLLCEGAELNKCHPAPPTGAAAGSMSAGARTGAHDALLGATLIAIVATLALD